MNSNNNKTLSTDIILIERDVLYDSTIDSFAKCLYCILRYKENHTLKRCELSKASIQDFMNTKSTDQVTQAIKSLEKHNYIIVDHSPDGNKYYFRENIERPITVFVNLINNEKLHYISKLIYILIVNHHGMYSKNDLANIIHLNSDTITKGHYLTNVLDYDSNIKTTQIAKCNYYYYKTYTQEQTSSRLIEIPSDLSNIRISDKTTTDTFISDAAITLYAYLMMKKSTKNNYVAYYADYVKKFLGLEYPQVQKSISKLVDHKFIKQITDNTRPFIVEIIKPKSTYTIYTDPLISNTLSEDPIFYKNKKSYLKAISYYIEHYNDGDLPQNREYEILCAHNIIRRNHFIDYSSQHKNDRFCPYNIETRIGTELFNDPCSPIGIAGAMMRDAILNQKPNESKGNSLYKLVFSNKCVNFEALLSEFIYQSNSVYPNIKKYLYSAFNDDISKFTIRKSTPEPEPINICTYNNAFKLIIKINAISGNVIYASNCHNATQNNIEILFDISKIKITTGVFIVTLKALKKYNDYFEYHLLSYKPYTSEKIYSIEHPVSDDNAIVFFDKPLTTLKHQMLEMCGTGVALKNAYNLTVPFKCKITLKKTPGHLYTIDHRLALKIKLIGEYYNFVDGLNIYCDDYQIHIGNQNDFNVLMSTIKMAEAHIDAISPDWDKFITNGVINITNLTTALKTIISDKNTIDKYISILEMIRPITLLAGVSDFNLFKDSKLKQSMNRSLCEKLITTYGLNSLYEIKSNPYSLLFFKSDQLPISFDTIDKYVYSIGIKYNDQIRMDGIITYLVQTFTESGSVGIDISDICFGDFINNINNQSLFTTSLTLKDVIDYTDKSTLAKLEGDYIVSRELYDSELDIATNIKRIIDASSHIRITDPDIDNFARENLLVFDADQKTALKAINDCNVIIIQGSAGTGKSYIIKCLIKLFKQLYPACEYSLVTPTGKAARVYRDIEATTIHRLLGYQTDKGFSECKFTTENPIPANLIIIDEASMVDINAVKALLDAVASGSKIVFVGDQNQLLPVEAGQIFRDLIASEKIHTIILNKIYRTESTTIINNANCILEGKNTFISDLSFDLIIKDNSGQVIVAAQELAHSLYGSYDRLGVQVLTHSKKDTDKINQHIKSNALIKESFISLRGYKKYHVGEKIIFTKNDVDNKYVNGQIGIITGVDDDNKTMEITTNNRVTTLKLGYKDLKNIDSAYAITIHKSQGSEYEQVIIALTDNADTLLCRELLYTAITRASKKVTIIATENSLNVALSSTSNRITFLSKIIRDLI